jgi:hypothetical protein
MPRPSPQTKTGRKRNSRIKARKAPRFPDLPKVEPATLKALIEYVTGDDPGQFDLSWAPNVFGICAYLLSKSGGYIELVRSWPSKLCKDYLNEVERIGEEWNQPSLLGPVPTEVARWWEKLLEFGDEPFEACSRKRDICDLILLLGSTADEACAGIGIPDPTQHDQIADRDLWASYLLQDAGTLSPNLRKEICRVFPKSHTPQSGITIRSLSHNLSFIWGNDVVPVWNHNPRLAPKNKREKPSLNLLLIPFPFKVSADDFRESDAKPLGTMDDSFGFFEYVSQATNRSVNREIIPILKKAKAIIGRVDGVILPELALTETTFDRLQTAVRNEFPQAFLAAGLGTKGSTTSFARNFLRVAQPKIADFYAVHDQAKHHRWKLTESQIRQYDLCHRLDPYTQWWEAIDVENRRLHFFAAEPWLTMCFLICEDLARQDPVAQAVRAIGPNLIVSLLMDGPQLSGRWANRYATVFADDPGSSVLSMTSLGMAMRSRPPQGMAPSRVVALWKEPDKPSQEITLESDSNALVLAINQKYVSEWTADGRADGQATGTLSLGGVHQVRT